MGLKILSMLTLAGLISPPLSYAETKVSIDGYFKDYTSIIILRKPPLLSDIISDAIYVSTSNRFRVNLRIKSPGIWSMHAAYDLTYLAQSRELFDLAAFGDVPGGRRFRVSDLESQLSPGEGVILKTTALYQNLDRLRLRVSTAPLDLIVGRQAIAWGAARVINPTDIVSPFGYTKLDTEDRIGVDAIRVRVPLGTLSEFDAGFIAGPDFDMDSSALFARCAFNTNGADVSVIAMRVGDHVLAGIDLMRSLGGAGIWLEMAYMDLNYFNTEDFVRIGYTRISAGVDYSFAAAWYTFLEYHYSGPGSNDPDDYIRVATERPIREGLIYLLGKHYLAPGAVYQITPLWAASAGALINLGDPSALVSPRLEYNVAENVYMEAGAHIGVGSASYLENSVFPIIRVRIGSEFGSYSDQLYFSFRYYF